MPAGYWCPVLHAHLPYVRHPEYPSFLEEDWFFEALTETYVPILRVLDGLLNDGVEYRLTMTLSPPLVSMMTDDLLVGRYHRHLDNLVELARREVDRTKRWQPQFHDLAWFYLHEFSDVRRIFREVYGSNLVSAFRKHRDAGQARDHHLRRDPRVLPAHGPGAAGGARPGAGRGRALPQALRPPPRRDLAARVRLHAGPRGLPQGGRPPLQLPRVARPHGRPPAPELRGPRPDRLAGRDRLLRPRHGVLPPGLERGVGLPGRLRLPRVLQGRGLGAADGGPRGLPPRRREEEPRDQVLPRDRAGHRPRPQAALRARVGDGEGGEPRRRTSSSTASSRSSTSPATAGGRRSWSAPTTPSSTGTGGSRGRSSSTSCSARCTSTRTW